MGFTCQLNLPGVGANKALLEDMQRPLLQPRPGEWGLFIHMKKNTLFCIKISSPSRKCNTPPACGAANLDTGKSQQRHSIPLIKTQRDMIDGRISLHYIMFLKLSSLISSFNQMEANVLKITVKIQVFQYVQFSILEYCRRIFLY